MRYVPSQNGCGSKIHLPRPAISLSSLSRPLSALHSSPSFCAFQFAQNRLLALLETIHHVLSQLQLPDFRKLDFRSSPRRCGSSFLLVSLTIFSLIKLLIHLTHLSYSNVIGGTYSGPPAEAWQVLDSCEDCYLRLAKFLAQHMDSFLLMWLCAFCRFVIIWVLIDMMKVVVVCEARRLCKYYCARRQERLVDDKKKYNSSLQLGLQPKEKS